MVTWFNIFISIKGKFQPLEYHFQFVKARKNMHKSLFQWYVIMLSHFKANGK